MAPVLHLQAWGLSSPALCTGPKTFCILEEEAGSNSVRILTSVGLNTWLRGFIAALFGNNFPSEKVKTIIWHP